MRAIVTASVCVPLLAAALLQGCATVRTPVPPESYRTLPDGNYTVVTAQGITRRTEHVQPTDSALVMTQRDLERYPVVVRYPDIVSVAAERRKSFFHIQGGFVVGASLGEKSRDYADVRGVAELGYLTGEFETVKPRWGFGGTGYLALAEDIRVGMKAIVRRNYSNDVSLDISAGPMITYEAESNFEGFIGGLALNTGPFTLRSEFMSYPFDAWDTYSEDHPAGRENVWYNGVTFNGATGSVAITVGMLGLILIGFLGGE